MSTIPYVKISTDLDEYPSVYLIQRETEAPGVEKYFSDLDKKSKAPDSVLAKNVARRAAAVPCYFTPRGVQIGGYPDPYLVYGVDPRIPNGMSKLAQAVNGRPAPTDIGWFFGLSPTFAGKRNEEYYSHIDWANYCSSLGIHAGGALRTLTPYQGDTTKLAEQWAYGWVERRLGVPVESLHYEGQTSSRNQRLGPIKGKTMIGIPFYTNPGYTLATMDCGWVWITVDGTVFPGVEYLIFSTWYPYDQTTSDGSHNLDLRLILIAGERGAVDYIASHSHLKVESKDLGTGDVSYSAPGWGTEGTLMVYYHTTREPPNEVYRPEGSAAPIGDGWYDHFTPWGVSSLSASVILTGNVLPVPEKDGRREFKVLGCDYTSVVSNRVLADLSKDQKADGLTDEVKQSAVHHGVVSTFFKTPYVFGKGNLAASRFGKWLSSQGGDPSSLRIDEQSTTDLRTFGDLDKKADGIVANHGHQYIWAGRSGDVVSILEMDDGKYVGSKEQGGTEQLDVPDVKTLVLKGIPLSHEGNKPYDLYFTIEDFTPERKQPTGEMHFQESLYWGGGPRTYTSLPPDVIAEIALLLAASDRGGLDKLLIQTMVQGQAIRREFERYMGTVDKGFKVNLRLRSVSH